MEDINREKLEVLVKEAPVALAMFDTKLRYIISSKKWNTDYGLDGEAIIGKSHYEIFPEIEEEWKKIHQDCLNGTYHSRDEDRFVRVSGKVQWIKWDVRPWYEGEKIGGLIMYTEDITEQKKKEELFREANKVARVGGWEFDLLEQKLSWTDITKEIHEVSPDYVPQIATAINFYKEGSHREKIQKMVDDAIEHGKTYDEELMILTAKANEKWVRVKVHSQFHEGKCIRVYGTFQDINLRKTQEVEMRKKEALYKLLADNMKNIVCLHDPDGKYTYVSPSFKEFMGYDPEEMIGQNPYDFFHPDDIKRIKIESHEKAVAGEDINGIEYRFRQKNGEYIWVNTLTRPIIENEEVKALQTDTYVVQERKMLEEELRRSEETFRGAFENSAIGMALVGLNGDFLKVNNRLCEIVGYTKEELVDLTFQDITHPNDLNEDLELLQELIFGKRESYTLDKRYFHKEGFVVWINLAVSMVKDENNAPLYFVAQIKDVTARRMAEENLQKTLSQLQGILDASTQVAIIGTNLKGIITTFNKGAENLLGYSAKEMVGRQTPALFHLPNEVAQRGKELSEQFGRPIKGFDVFVEYARKGEFESREWTYRGKFGNRFPVQLSVTALKSSTDKIVGYLGVATDISIIKQKEKELQELVNMTDDQNKRLVNFAHIVSHNLRSHTSNLAMMLGLYEYEQEESRKTQTYNMIKKASENLNETVQHLSEVVKINTNINEKRSRVNLREEVEKVQDSVKAMILENEAEIINDIPDNLNLNLVPAYIESILLNFLTNAIKYKSYDRSPVVRFSAVANNGTTTINIEDNGVGIDLEKHKHKLFGMYKTFHDRKDSRGIGLFITKNQIEAMGGKVNVESQPEEGTTFKITFYDKN